MVIGSPRGGSGRPALLLGSALVQFMLCSLARGQAFQGSPQGGMRASPLPFPPLPLRASPIHHVHRDPLLPSPLPFASASRKPSLRHLPSGTSSNSAPSSCRLHSLILIRIITRFNHVQIIDCRSKSMTQLSQLSVQTFPHCPLYLMFIVD